jgi:spore coat polysaccharide biosynthesis protein SpsF (cytidylyltransferase family)
VDVVVIAVADDHGSDIVAHHAEAATLCAHSTYGDILPPVRVVRGPERDVLKRYVMAAEVVKATTIMRITSDCPMLHPEICAAVLAKFNEGPCDYASNVHPRSYPQGYDCEVFSSRLLELADLSADSNQREHVTTWMVENAGVRMNLESGVDQSDVRLTLDTIDDYVTIWNEFENASH